MGLLAVLNLKQIEIAQQMTEPERADGGKGGKGGAAAPKLARVAVEPEIEKTGGKGGSSTATDTATAPQPETGGGQALRQGRSFQRALAAACHGQHVGNQLGPQVRACGGVVYHGEMLW